MFINVKWNFMIGEIMGRVDWEVGRAGRINKLRFSSDI